MSLYGSRLRDFNDFFKASERRGMPQARFEMRIEWILINSEAQRLDYFDLQRALRRLDIFVTPQARAFLIAFLFKRSLGFGPVDGHLFASGARRAL